MNRIKNLVKPVAWILLAAVGYAYDWYRFARHAGQRYRPSANRRQYSVMKIYHRLEKSLSLSGRTPGHGRGAVHELLAFLRPLVLSGHTLNYQEAVGLKVLSEFIKAEAPHSDYSAQQAFLASASDIAATEGGANIVDCVDIAKGKLADPAAFFESRHSIRDFTPQAIDDACLAQAVSLAMCTPSVCNRQGWHVYRTSDRSTIAKALSLQNGNHGFSERIPTLLIVTADLNAFDTSAERYQHWIDGGMFTMSLVWALHAMGLGSCCLNWSKGVGDDVTFRKRFNITGNHTILTMMAVGNIPETVSVCASPRTPIESIITDLESR